jgi:uncharacterized membrane protein
MSRRGRAFLIGVVSGGRSLTGLAATALTTAPGAAPRALAGLTGTTGRRLLVLGALGELVADKFPRVPSRLSPPSLVIRTAAAVTAAAVLAARDGARPAGMVLPAAAGALAGSFAGARWRASADRRHWPPMVAAVLEDAVVAGLAVATTRNGEPGS